MEIFYTKKFSKDIDIISDDNCSSYHKKGIRNSLDVP